MKLVVRPAAATEVEEAAVWYDAQQPGLGSEFLDAVAGVVARIVERPLLHPIVRRDTRRACVPRFPYAVLYRVVGDEIRVVACFHGSRDPRVWHGRR